MNNSIKKNHQESSMDVMKTIYNRSSIRDYLSSTVDKKTLEALLDAAVHAPTAMHEEPCAFVIIQNKDLLNRLSDTAIALVRSEAHGFNKEQSKHALEIINQPDFHVFYNASTLIIIYSKFDGPFVAADCWLAAENLMLAARAKQLGTCVIGFAVSALNTPEWKQEFGIPTEMTAIVPIIIGLPAHDIPTVSRKKPTIITWK